MRSVTSASNIFRRRLCPGSENLEATVIEEEGDNAPADEGTLLHHFATTPALKRDHLTEAQQRLLDTAERQSADFFVAAARQFDCSGVVNHLWIEETVAIYGPDGEHLFNGQSDLARHWPGFGVAVEDFKMGFVDVTHAAENYQLAAYAVGWSDYLSEDKAIVGINQPRAKRRLTQACYDRKGLDAAKRELAAIKHAAEDPNAPRIAGEAQCHFCKAKLFCDEYKARFSALDHRPEAKSVAMLENDELSRFGIACKAADAIKGPVFAEIRKRIAAGEMPEWELKETGETRELADMLGAYRELSAYFERLGGFTPEGFTACTEIRWTKLVEYVRAATGFSQPKARRLIDELLNPYVIRKQKAATPQPVQP